MSGRRTGTAGFVAGVLVGLLGAAPVRAQAGDGSSEGLFLLLPVGAQAVGMAEAVVAQRGGSDALWWNPSAVAGGQTREVALHHSQTILGQGNVLTIAFPIRRFGTLVPSLNVLDLEEQTSTSEGQIEQGVIIPTNVIASLTYAAVPIPFLAVGVTAKHGELRIRCSGLCENLPTGGVVANAVDLGAQLRWASLPLTFGVAVRNLGAGQGDTRPERVDVGANYRVQAIDRYTKDVELYTSAGVVTTTRSARDSAAYRAGADIVFERRIHVRGGYLSDPAGGSGAAIGFGISTGKFVFDLARTFGGLSADNNNPPTYFSLRYLW